MYKTSPPFAILGGGSDNEHRQGEHRSNNDDDAVAEDSGDDNMDVDVPSNHVRVFSSFIAYTSHFLYKIQVSSPPSTPSKKASNRIRQRLGLSSSPASSRSRSSVSSDLLTPPSRRRGGKITEKHFTPNTRRLAILGKRMNRRATATKQPFPTDKHAYNMEILQELANEYKGEGDMIEVFARVLASVDTQQELVQFVSFMNSFLMVFFNQFHSLSRSSLAMPEVGSSPTVWQRLGNGSQVALGYQAR